MMNIFFKLICHLYIIFGEVFVFFGHLKIMLFILLLMSFKSSLYILDNNPLSRCVFYNIFSQFVVCLIS